MNVFFTVLVVNGLTATSLGSCPGDICTSRKYEESVSLGEDAASGCFCREIVGTSTFCYGRETCHKFPRNLNFTTKMFMLKSSQVAEIEPGDLAKVAHVEILKIEGNYNLVRVARGSFKDLKDLRNLSISYNANLKSLEQGCFDGLGQLESLYLMKNGFGRLSDVTAPLGGLRGLLKLDLSENNFQTVAAGDFEVLQGSQVEELSLILCQIEDIDTKAFNPLGRLKILKLGENNFNASTIAAVVEETIGKVPLDFLSLYATGLKKSSSRTLLDAVARTNITKLCLARNQFEVINSELFPPMPHLQTLNLQEVLALNVTNDAFTALPSLRTLILNGNKLASIPEGALLEQLKYLDLRQNSGDRFSSYFTVFGKKFMNMKKLERLDLGYNALHALYTGSFTGLESLLRLGLKNATIYKIANGTFMTLPKLESLNLENNFFLRNYSDEERVFKGLNNLKKLFLGGCGITTLKMTLFEDLVQLQYLGLENNKLTVLPSFRSLVSLTIVDLSGNTLQPWQKSVFSHNHDLKEVKIGDNKFTLLTKTMVEDFDNLHHLDLSGNPFTCDCSFSWGTKKMLSLLGNQTVFCAFPESASDLKVSQFLQTTPQCFNLPLVISSVIFTLIVTITAFTIYYFRWHLKYWLFLTRLHLSRNHIIKPTQSYTNYLYDAFVSYSSEDTNFVVRLVTMLENHPPFVKLCVFERDFEIGTVISENILESVAKSRRTILVISDSYARSQWCRWESHIAEHHRLFLQNEDGKYTNDSIILIKLGPVNEGHLTPILRYLLKTRIYLPWEAEEKKQKVFWEKLRGVLAPPKEVNENTWL